MTFDQVLDLCLEEMRNEGASITECLNRYPQFATQLKPLLTTAKQLNKANQVRPSREFKARLRKKLESDSEEKQDWKKHLRGLLTVLLVVSLAPVVSLSGSNNNAL